MKKSVLQDLICRCSSEFGPLVTAGNCRIRIDFIVARLHYARQCRFPFQCDPCHHVIRHLPTADAGDGTAANDLNKESRRADKSGLPSWVFDVGLITLQHK
jgi:hypothetical protein